MKGKIYKLEDGYSYICVSENGEYLVFAQIYYTDPSEKVSAMNLDNVKIVNKSDSSKIEQINDDNASFLKVEFTK